MFPVTSRPVRAVNANMKEAQVRRQRNSLQLSYDLPFRPSTSSTYPLPTYDGSTILVCGHEKGLSLFKIHAKEQENTSTTQPLEDVANGQSRAAGRQATAWLDVGLESPVLQVAFPPVTTAHASARPSRLPDLLRSSLIAIVACADSSIYLVSVELDASTRDSDGKVKITSVSSALSHHDLVASIALTWTRDDQEKHPRSRSRGTDANKEVDTQCLSFLIASVSATGSGLLITHRISFQAHIDADSHSVSAGKHLVRMPLSRSTLAFTPSIYPSPKHTLLSLTSPAYGLVRVLDLKSGRTQEQRKRDEDSSDTTDSSLPAPRACMTLYTTHAASSSPSKRKDILDARWISSGHGIVGLLEDGEWGVWDIDAAKGNRTISTMQQNLTRFPSIVSSTQMTVHGNLSNAVPRKETQSKKQASALAPMTPHTRKTQARDLFAGQQQLSGTKQTSSTSLGHIYILDTQNSASHGAIMISYDGVNHLVPSLQPSRSDSDFREKETATRSQKLPVVQLGGEKQQSIQILPSTSKDKSGGLFGVLNNTPDLLIVTDSRLILHTTVVNSGIEPTTTLNLPFRANIIKDIQPLPVNNSDILDIDAMDRILDNMDTTMPDGQSMLLAYQKPSVLGVLDSPSIERSNKSKLVIDQTGSTVRGLFV